MMDQKDLGPEEIKAHRRKNIAHLMAYGLPSRYFVRDSFDWGEYAVSDASGKVTVTVKFYLKDTSARYVFRIDGEDPQRADSDGEAVGCISMAVDSKLRDWIGTSEKRQNKVTAEASVNKILRHYENGEPMMFISPDKDPEAYRLPLKEELESRFRLFGFGYHRCDFGDGRVFFVVYSKPDKRREQLLKKIAAEYSRRYGIAGFSDLKGQICYMQGETSLGDEKNNLRDGVAGYYNTLTGCRSFCFDEIEVSNAYEPVERFMSTSFKIRRRNAFMEYCNACWDEEAQTYHFDQRFDRFF